MIKTVHNRPPEYDLSNFTILVVEDSTYMQDLITSMLKTFGVGDILNCNDANEAIELLTVTQARTKSRYINNIDIVLTDWLMPKGSGEDLLKWIRNNDKDSIRFLPVVVISGYTTIKVTNETRDLGANETMVKPISANGLASRICSVIDNPRSFIKAPHYFGPDRRRQQVAFTGADKRITIPSIVEREI